LPTFCREFLGEFRSKEVKSEQYIVGSQKLKLKLNFLETENLITNKFVLEQKKTFET
jgi:hypothetical protein